MKRLLSHSGKEIPSVGSKVVVVRTLNSSKVNTEPALFGASTEEAARRLFTQAFRCVRKVQKKFHSLLSFNFQSLSILVPSVSIIGGCELEELVGDVNEGTWSQHVFAMFMPVCRSKIR